MLLNQHPEKKDFIQLAETTNVIPVWVEILADTMTPVSLLMNFHRRGGPVFLLESVEGGERWGRYSFLGASARGHIRVYRDVVTVEEKGVLSKTPHNGDPLAVLKELMDRYRPAVIPGLPRFWGGMVGYLTYEMVSFFEDIPNQWPVDKPLAHFVIPDELIIFDNIRNTLLAIAPAFLDDDDKGEARVERAYEEARSRIRTMLDAMDRAEPVKNGLETGARDALSACCDEDDFRTMVKTVKEHIRAGDIIQAVVSQPFVCENPPDPCSLYRAQRYVNPSP
ncbi:MAG: anthranilate synthase component I, partial [Desulfobacterales bacterium]|nr:anthranilate synthase component I [Desulfobacterales bacterium]